MKPHNTALSIPSLLLLAALHLLGIVHSADAQLAVDRMLFGIPYDSRPAISVNVSNTDTQRSLRVNVESVRLSHPEENPEDEVTEDALIVSPMHFTLPPGESRSVRILRRKPSVEKEEAFRVNFNPEADDSDLAASGKGKSVGIRVLFGIGLLIFTEPKQERRSVHWDFKDGQLELSNTGNVNFVIDEIEFCPATGDCQKDKLVKRIYAGGKVSLPWNGTDIVRFRRTFIEDSDRVEINIRSGDK